MDFLLYGEDTGKLVEEIRVAAQKPGQRIFTLLRTLKKQADATDSDELYAFLYYSYAITYSYREEHVRFFQYLKKALYYLLRLDEKDMLVRAYNLFAIEAQKNGCVDVAYDYFSMSLSFASDDAGSMSYAMVLSNTGGLLFQMGEYRRAISYIRKSIPIISKYQDDVLSRQYLAVMLISLARCYLAAGDTDHAKKTVRRVERVMETIKPEARDMAERCYTLFKARIAVENAGREELEQMTEDVCEQIISHAVFPEFMYEVHHLVRALLQARVWDLAGRLLDEIEKNTTPQIPRYGAGLFAQARIDHARAIGDKALTRWGYHIRHSCSHAYREVQKQIYNESIELMELIRELRDERIRVAHENLILEKRAETDALTGLPNRYAMTRVMEEAFKRGLQGSYPVAVGIVDVDDFKHFNDTYGHVEGDYCLMDVAEHLSAVADKAGMFVARYGGDEFVFVGENMDEEEITDVTRRISALAPAPMTCGFFSAVPNEESRIWDYLAVADRELYHRKHG